MGPEAKKVLIERILEARYEATWDVIGARQRTPGLDDLLKFIQRSTPTSTIEDGAHVMVLGGVTADELHEYIAFSSHKNPDLRPSTDRLRVRMINLDAPRGSSFRGKTPGQTVVFTSGATTIEGKIISID